MLDEEEEEEVGVEEAAEEVVLAPAAEVCSALCLVVAKRRHLPIEIHSPVTRNKNIDPSHLAEPLIQGKFY